MSGIAFLSADSTGHIATPATGTWTTLDGTAIAGMPGPGSYPLAATCKICRVRITLTHVLQLEWRHEPAPAGGTT